MIKDGIILLRKSKPTSFIFTQAGISVSVNIFKEDAFYSLFNLKSLTINILRLVSFLNIPTRLPPMLFNSIKIN